MADLFGIHHDNPEYDMRAALVAIQELHKPYRPTRATAVYCAHCFEDGGYDGALHVLYPCPTRRLADEALNQ